MQPPGDPARIHCMGAGLYLARICLLDSQDSMIMRVQAIILEIKKKIYDSIGDLFSMSILTE